MFKTAYIMPLLYNEKYFRIKDVVEILRILQRLKMTTLQKSKYLFSITENNVVYQIFIKT